MDELRMELKELIIETLELTDVTPGQIEDEAPLFGEGLGLDSLDALELVVALEDRYGIEQNLEAKEATAVFRSIATLSDFVAKERQT